MLRSRSHALAEYVGIVARGSGRGRALTRQEASEAMGIILSGAADPEAIGALLMVLRYRGETPEEIAGFAHAARASLDPWRNADVHLDWPSYAAGRTRGLPYFLLSAFLLAGEGVRTLMHGGQHQASLSGVGNALPLFGLAPARTPDEARADLDATGFAYVPLTVLSPRLLELLRLRHVLGLRSCINTVLRLLNPSLAAASIQGVFHPPYVPLQIDAGIVLGDARVSVFKGGGGEAERTPFKPLTAATLRDGVKGQTEWPALIPGLHRRLNEDEDPDPATLLALWRGDLSDVTAEAVIVGTAAIALETTGRATADEADRLAFELWQARDRLAFPRHRQAA